MMRVDINEAACLRAAQEHTDRHCNRAVTKVRGDYRYPVHGSMSLEGVRVAL